MTLPPLTLYLAAPRGFCAGVDRAIKIVELALQKWGAPVYVRHEIVHNKFVVDALRAQGAVFVEELSDCPPDRPVIFSAHGVPKSVPAEASARQMIAVDATCPLVTKVHNEAARHNENGLQLVMIGHAGHPETIGTMGQLPPGEVLLVETEADVATLTVRDPAKLAYITQTTLSVDDTAGIAAALHARFPQIQAPAHEDICYATTNRQIAVKTIAPRIDALLVIGAPNSSNSMRLVEVGRSAGCSYAQLVQRAADIDWRALQGIRSLGLTAGASAPEVLVNEVIDAFRARYAVTVELVETAQENIEFKVPRVLRGTRMTPVPRVPLILALAGLLPFLWSVATELTPALADFGLLWMGPRFLGPYVGLAYGTVILSFMSGALWGFATRAEANRSLFYGLSVLPALWAFLFVGGGPVSAAIYLATGFIALLGIDWLFDQHGLTPPWWMTLRSGLTVVVVLCLAVTAFA